LQKILNITSNDIKYLNATEKGNLVFQNSPSLEMRVTLINGKKKYFISVTLE
jgi:hypothetical protein